MWVHYSIRQCLTNIRSLSVSLSLACLLARSPDCPPLNQIDTVQQRKYAGKATNENTEIAFENGELKQWHNTI